MKNIGTGGKTLAMYGGTPVRREQLPYGHQDVREDDILAVIQVLRSEWITTGPKVEAFEEAMADYLGVRHAVSFSSGTAALHGAAFVAGLGAGDEAITTPLTFCATANSVIYTGARPVFADVSQDTLNLDPVGVERQINPHTKAVIGVDYGGNPCAIDELLSLSRKQGLVFIEDASHSLGAEYKGRRVGNLAHLTTFSFHPIKHITTGEGGMVTTDDSEYAKHLRSFRNHGIDQEAREHAGAQVGEWFYEMTTLGYNYRLSDIACALGLSQIQRLGENIRLRRGIASQYNERLRDLVGLELPVETPHGRSSWHLYPIRLRLERLSVDRKTIFRALRAENIQVNVHYVPVHLHPLYKERFGYAGGEYPVAESAYDRLITLPLFHSMTQPDIDDVVNATRKVLGYFQSDSVA